MSKKLFVGNIPYKLSEANLKEIFLEFGEVESTEIIVDKRNRRSRGYGFVEMNNENNATKAIKKLNGKVIHERKLVVQLANKIEVGIPKKEVSFSHTSLWKGVKQLWQKMIY